MRSLIALVVLSASAKAAVVCPGAQTLEGVDVSEFQGSIDWAQVKASGRSFAIARVSDGLGHPDPYFAQNWSGMKAAGLIRGAYQFFRPSEDPVAQANMVLSAMGTLTLDDLPPTIDVEVTDGVSGAQIASGVRAWIDRIQAVTGRVPIVYTGTWFWDPNVGSGAFSSNPLWESWYCSSCCPNLPNPWSGMSIWQYSDMGSVPGIGGAVDLDKFNGSAADLARLAGGNVDWSARYVSQSFPLASMSMSMVVNQRIPAVLEMQNTGQKTWDANTRIGTTQPRDRKSAFAAADWVGPARASAVTGMVPPGASYKFKFTWQAPDKPGSFHEFFSLVEEGVAWFSDPGQGGPADNQIEAWIEVVEADYHADLAAQSFATDGPVSLVVGTPADGWVELKNVGKKSWRAGMTKLAPTPRDQASPFATTAWLSPTRVSTLAKDVAPGEVARFALPLGARSAGTHTLTFTLVEEGVTWFGDAPAGGGPRDDGITLSVVATEPGMGPGPTSGPHGGTHMGCSFGGAHERAPGAWWLLALAALFVRRRLAR